MAQENGDFYTIDIQKEQIAGPKNDHTMRKTPGPIFLVRDMGFIFRKEDPPKLYKIDSALKSDKLCLNGLL
jgi:hypothetical protein